jgi:hypothetical protein
LVEDRIVFAHCLLPVLVLLKDSLHFLSMSLKFGKILGICRAGVAWDNSWRRFLVANLLRRWPLNELELSGLNTFGVRGRSYVILT